MDNQHQSSSSPSAFLSSQVTSNASNNGTSVTSSGSSSTPSASLQIVSNNIANQRPKRACTLKNEISKKLRTDAVSINSNHNNGTAVMNGNLPNVITDWTQSYIPQYFVPCLKTVQRKVSINKKNTQLFEELWNELKKTTFSSASEVFKNLYSIVGKYIMLQDSAKEAGKVQKLMTLKFQQVADMFGLCCPLPKSEFMTECSKCKKMCHHCCTGYNAELRTPVNPICVKCKATMPLSTNDIDYKALDLPECKSSEYMEKKTKELMIEYRRNFVSEMTSSNVHSDERIPNIFIRMVSSQKKTFVFQNPQMRGDGQMIELAGNYYENTYWVFLEHDGQEMIVFGMQVHEYLKDNHPCNACTAYVSALESVKHLETTIGYNVFRSVVASYFSWCKTLGFHKGHIWSSIGAAKSNFLFVESPSDGMSQNQLDEWFGKLMMEMYDNGILYSQYTPKREVKSNEELPHCDGGFFTKNKYNSIKQLNTLLKNNADSLFMFELYPRERLVYFNVLRPIIETRKAFFDICQRRGWKFGTLRETVHATKALVQFILAD